MHLDGFDLIENIKGDLVAINCETSSVRHYEIFAVSKLPSPPKIEIVPDEDVFVVTVEVHLPATNTTFNIQGKAATTLRGPVAEPSVSHIAMYLTGNLQIVAMKFRGKWIVCWSIP